MKWSRLIYLLRRHRLKLAGGACALLLVAAGLWAIWRMLDRRAVLDSPAPTLLVEDVRGRFIAEVCADDRRKGYWPPPAQLPPRIVAATLAAEDARYFNHGGVDFRSVCRAIWQNMRQRKRVSGASTVAMQVARIQNPGGRTYSRKLSESLVARALVRKFGHEAVLRHYLQIAPYGNQNHGAAYAARRYFDKPLEDLTWAESAMIAGLPKLPGRMNILRWEGRRMAERRALYVLGRLRTLRWITPAEYAEARDLLPKLEIATRETRPSSCLHAALAMERELKGHPASSAGPQPYLVRSTLDMDLQEEVQIRAWRAMEKFRPEGAGNVAALVVEKNTGRILAYLGSEDYFDEENSGAIDYAIRLRSSGSTLKPFIYAQGMAEKGFTAGTLLTDVGMALNWRGGGYLVRNYDEAFLGPILYRNALANSRNIPAIQVLQEVGIERAYQRLHELGLARENHDAAYYGSGLAIGGLPVTLVDLVRAYGVLANEGREFDLRWFDYSRGAGASPAKEDRAEAALLPRRFAHSPFPRFPPRQVIPEDVARQITLFLSDPMARLPSFPRMGALEYPFAVAVKTGTSQGYRDAWCVAYSSNYLVGVWMGHPKNYTMNRTSGAGSAAELAHSIMDMLHPEEMKGLAEKPFPPPRGWVARRVCMLSGRLASEDCASVAVEWFKPGSEPLPERGVHRKIQVDVRTNKAAAPDCPSLFAKMKSFTVLEPRFASWARESGLELLPPELAEGPTGKLRPATFRLVVTKPRPGTLLKDPEAPAGLQTIALEATVDPAAPQVVWVVDGKPFKVVDYPYSARWAMEEGTHTFQVRLPYAPVSSPRTSVTVKP